MRATNHLPISLCFSFSAFTLSLRCTEPGAWQGLWFRCDSVKASRSVKSVNYVKIWGPPIIFLFSIFLFLSFLFLSLLYQCVVQSLISMWLLTWLLPTSSTELPTFGVLAPFLCLSISSHVTQPVCRLSHSLKQSLFYANVRRFAVVTCLVKIERGIESASKCVLAWELLQSYLLTWKSNLKIFITLMGTTQIIQMNLFSLWRMFWHKMFLKLFVSRLAQFEAISDVLLIAISSQDLQAQSRNICFFFIGPKSNCFCGFFLFPWGNTTQTQL